MPFSGRQAYGAVSTNILHFFARVVVFTCPDPVTAAAPRVSLEVADLTELELRQEVLTLRRRVQKFASAVLAKALKKHLKSKHYRENPLGVIFTNRNARPYSDNKLRVYKFHPLTRKLGIKHCGFHAFRHGVASELIDSGAPISVVRDQLRHSDVSTTLELYSHVVGNARREAVENLTKKMVA